MHRGTSSYGSYTFMTMQAIFMYQTINAITELLIASYM